MRKLRQKGNKRNFPENLQNQQSNLTLILGITVVLGPFKEASDRMTKDGCLSQLVTEVLKPHQYASFLMMVTRPLMRKGGFIEETQKINHKWTQNLFQQEGLGNCYKRITKMFTNWEKLFAKNQEKSSIGRQVKIFPKQLAENNWKPCYLRNEERLFNRFP